MIYCQRYQNLKAMSLENRKKWQKEHPEGKAFLSWNLADYLANDIEPLPCVVQGTTEGETMEEESVEEWLREELVTLSIIKENYPEKFDEQLKNYLLDLEYLMALGKISKEECQELSKEENFYFGQQD